MTIKETEQLTGMPRASIRFYEAEGLICPQREKNGYRIYEQEDVDALLRIRLLRTLEVSLEELRELTEGRLTLADCLTQHTAQLEETRERAGRAVEVCRQMAEAEAEFRSLNAGRWLALLETAQPAPVPEQEILPKPGLIRRYLARGIDLSLYTLLWELLLAGVFRMNLATGITGGDTPLWMRLLENAVLLVCIFLFEPLFLHRWGATPGKWIMGIRVTDDRGGRLSWRDALGRCGMLLAYCYAFGIPILMPIRQIRCLLDVRKGEEPEWEWDSRLELKTKSRIRAAVLSAVCVAVMVMLQAEIRTLPELPPNRGNLTVEEFAENFNALQRYYEEGTGDYIFSGDMRELAVKYPWQLDESACWTAREGAFYAWIYSGREMPQLLLDTEEDGTVSGVMLRWHTGWEAGSDSDAARRGRVFQREIFLMRLALQAFGGAQRSNRLPFSGWRAVQDISANGWRRDYSLVHKNIAVDYDVEFFGCAPAENGAPRLEETAGAQSCSVSYTFTIRLQETPGRTFS